MFIMQWNKQILIGTFSVHALLSLHISSAAMPTVHLRNLVCNQTRSHYRCVETMIRNYVLRPSAVALIVCLHCCHLQYLTAEWEPAFLRQAREFLFFPLLPREASKRVSIFDKGTGSKPERLKSGFLQADLSLIV